jgi:hypothetical protein
LRQAVCNAACVCGFAKQGRRDLVQTVVNTTVGSSGSSRTPFAGWLRLDIITIYINVTYSDCKRTILLGKAKRADLRRVGPGRYTPFERQRNRCVGQKEGNTPGSQSGAYRVGYMNATWAGLFRPTRAGFGINRRHLNILTGGQNTPRVGRHTWLSDSETTCEPKGG